MNPQVISKFKSKKGREIILRTLSIADLEELTRYINKLSSEDTYITFSGEVMSKEDEEKYLTRALSAIAVGDKVVVIVEHEGKIIGNADVTRNKNSKTRSLHTAILGISIDADYREEGIGRQLMTTAIDQARTYIPNLKTIVLHVFGDNTIAQKLYESVGFKEAGRIPNGVYRKEQYVDDVIMYLNV